MYASIASSQFHNSFWASRISTNALDIFRWDATKEKFLTITFKKFCDPENFGWSTLGLCKRDIVCCSYKRSKIYVIFPKKDEPLQIFGARGTGKAAAAGRMKHPYICDYDDSGNLLICDRGNKRLQVMTSDGRFSVVPLRLSGAFTAVFVDGRLIVACRKTGTISKYAPVLQETDSSI